MVGSFECPSTTWCVSTVYEKYGRDVCRMLPPVPPPRDSLRIVVARRHPPLYHAPNHVVVTMVGCCNRFFFLSLVINVWESLPCFEGLARVLHPGRRARPSLISVQAQLFDFFNFRAELEPWIKNSPIRHWEFLISTPLENLFSYFGSASSNIYGRPQVARPALSSV